MGDKGKSAPADQFLLGSSEKTKAGERRKSLMHSKSSCDNWRWHWSVSVPVLACQSGDVNLFDMFLSG